MTIARLQITQGKSNQIDFLQFTIELYILPMSNPEEFPRNLDFYACEYRLIWANERTVEPQFLQDDTKSEGNTVTWFIEKGTVAVDYPQGRLEARPGDWLFLRAGDGKQHFSKKSRVISLRFELRLRGGRAVFARERDLIFKGERFPKLQESAMRLVALIARHGEAGTLLLGRGRIPLAENFRIEAAFLDWLGVYVEVMQAAGEVPRVAGQQDDRVAQALLLIESHSMREKFSERTLATRCGLSVNQLVRLFTRETTISPFQYYEARRLRLARHALAESVLPVKEIAFELGFGSAPHFSNWFSKNEGASPRAFRNAKSGYTLA